MIQGLNSKDSADRICEELKKIVGIHKIEICFETEQMIIEADSLSMPRIINAVRSTIVYEDAHPCGAFLSAPAPCP